MQIRNSSQNGMILITTLFFLVVLLALLAAFFVITNLETGSFRSAKKSTIGFYAAEGGLNVRAEQIRQIFVGYNRPSGTSPNATDSCDGSNNGSGDFRCQSYDLNNRTVKTYIEEEPGNPLVLTIPPGELYQNLNAQEYRYTAKSRAIDSQGNIEALLELRFKSRLVPLFQFVAFYDKDLEILPGPTMNLSGPVHTNGDLYMECGNVLSIAGQVTAAGRVFRGRKNANTCVSNSTRVRDPLNYLHLVPNCPSRTEVLPTQVGPWNGMIQVGVESVTVPEPEALDPTPGQVYWDNSDLRLVLKLNAGNNPDTTNSPTAVEVRNVDNSLNAGATATLNNTGTCPGNIAGRVVGNSNSFYNNRENGNVRMLEIDMRKMLDCLRASNWFGTGKLLNDSSEGGLVLHFSVSGPNSASQNSRYGVRIRNAPTLQSTVVGAPQVRGMTVVSDQGVYTWGNYNSTSWIPAAILADTFNPLSGNWYDAPHATNEAPCSGGLYCSRNTNIGRDPVTGSNRVATTTSVYTAVLAGTDTTGGVEGTGGQGGAYNGGLENYPRFHEYWSNITFAYLGSFVSLNRPRHSSGAWVYGDRFYTAPIRTWDYDTRFNNAANLPPLTPRFVYLRQELFVRDFEQ